jgi:hypothetical protein
VKASTWAVLLLGSGLGAYVLTRPSRAAPSTTTRPTGSYDPSRGWQSDNLPPVTNPGTAAFALVAFPAVVGGYVVDGAKAVGNGAAEAWDDVTGWL